MKAELIVGGVIILLVLAGVSFLFLAPQEDTENNGLATGQGGENEEEGSTLQERLDAQNEVDDQSTPVDEMGTQNETPQQSSNDTNTAPKKEKGVPYVEIVDPSGFVNTGGITIGDLVGEKVILVDFLTYSCINCQRTFPYLTAWYGKYKDQGLEIVGIHTPEFAFEKDINNVRNAMEKFGITYPIVLDNDYATWRAYGNRFWPRKYLIDIYGNIVYDHIGEGAYEETEKKIQELLAERAEYLSESFSAGELAASGMPESENQSNSPETYFGSFRNGNLKNGTPGETGTINFEVPETVSINGLYLGGTWKLNGEYAESVEDGTVIYKYFAKEVYVVAESDEDAEIEVWQDGELVGSAAGEDVNGGVVTVKDSRLYKLINNESGGIHTLELRTKDKGVRFFAFTFG